MKKKSVLNRRMKMKKVLKYANILLVVVIVFLLSGCQQLKVTDQMQQYIDLYLQAVEKSENRTVGKVTVTSVLEDNAIEFKTTESVIECQYQVVDDSVIYERTDYKDGKEDAKYKCDGKTVKAYDAGSNSWIDKTEENKSFISAKTNPLTTLSLFRIDSNLKLRTEYLTDIKQYNSDDFTVVEFTLKDSTVSDVLSYYKADGIVRKSAGHTRSYYINTDGYISKIVVLTTQKMYSNGEEGTYNTKMVVECE